MKILHPRQPWWSKIFRAHPDWPWGILYNKYWLSFPDSKAAGSWHWPPTPI